MQVEHERHQEYEGQENTCNVAETGGGADGGGVDGFHLNHGRSGILTYAG